MKAACHDINISSLEEDKIAGRLNGNVLLERKVQIPYLLAVRSKDLMLPSVTSMLEMAAFWLIEMLDGLLAAIGFGLLQSVFCAFSISCTNLSSAFFSTSALKFFRP